MNKSKEDKSDCSCENCINSCKRTPGWFMPGEAEKVAEFMNISLEELINNYLIWDYYIGNNGIDQKVLSPFKTYEPNEILDRYQNRPGRIASFSFPFRNGKCVFLDENNKCKIHPVKPYECKQTFSCDDNQSGENIRKKIAEKWRKSKHVYSS